MTETNEIPTPTEDNPFFAVGTVARMMDVRSTQVRRWIKEGNLKAYMVTGRWRILKSDLRDFVNKEYGE